MIRAFVFDFDGVIANSEPLHFRAYRDVLAEHGLTLTEAAYYEHYLGYDDVGAFRAIGTDAGRPFAEGDVAALVARKAVRLEELERSGSVLFPGAREAIARMSSSWPTAIASGALKAEILRVLQHEGLASHFRTVVSAEDTEASKPDPAPYLRAVSLLADSVPNLQPHECVAIEDSRWGLQSARTAGLKTIGITHTYQTSALADAADLVIDHLDRLVPDLVLGLSR